MKTTSPKNLVIAVDIGGTNYRMALVDGTYNVLKLTRGKTLADNPARSQVSQPQVTLKRMAAEARSAFGTQYKRIKAVGIAFAGPIDSASGIAYLPPNLPTWDGANLRVLSSKLFGVPAYVGNDASLAAVGEHGMGAGIGMADIVFVTVSTGIGGGIISGGTLLLGGAGLAGELGHICIDKDGPECACGSRGCVEAIASGSAVARIAIGRLRAGERSACVKLAGGIDLVRAEHIYKAAASGDRMCKEIVRDAAQALGLAVVSYIHVFNPQAVIIGGGVAIPNWDSMAPYIKRVVKERAMPQFQKTVRILPARLGDLAGIVGAAVVANEQRTS